MSTQSNALPTRSSTHSVLGRLIWVSPLAIAITAVANLALYAVAGLILPEVTAWPGAGPAQIVGATAVYLLMGAVVLAIVARVSSRPVHHYRIVATLVLLLSLIPPLAAGLGMSAPGTPPASAATVVTLSLMHLVSYAISLPLYSRLALRAER